MTNTIQGSTSSSATSQTSNSAQDAKLNSEIKTLEQKLETLERDMTDKLSKLGNVTKKAEMIMEQSLIALSNTDDNVGSIANKKVSVEDQVKNRITVLASDNSNKLELSLIGLKIGKIENYHDLSDLKHYVDSNEHLSANNKEQIDYWIQLQITALNIR